VNQLAGALDGRARVRDSRAMPGESKKRAKRAVTKRSTDGVDAVRLIGATLAGHDAAIRQLAEVVVNLHENVRALREVADALAIGGTDKRVLGAIKRLRALRLDE
jgi:hypothetical protein